MFASLAVDFDADLSGDPLDGDREIGISLRRARHRVAPHVVLIADAHAERAELAGPVAEGLPEVVRHVEHERSGVVGLVDDLLDPERVVAVVPQDVVVVNHGHRASGRAHSNDTGTQ
jgi:hypothetical protein